MKKRQSHPPFTLGSIRYIHDPDAAQEWFHIYMKLVKQELLQKYSKESP